jgi:hypothetical protein
MQYTSEHDMPWFSDPDQPWGGSHKRIERDPDADYEAERDRRIDDALTDTPRTPEQIAARRAFVERFFSNAPDLQQRLAMLDAEARQ